MTVAQYLALMHLLHPSAHLRVHLHLHLSIIQHRIRHPDSQGDGPQMVKFSISTIQCLGTLASHRQAESDSQLPAPDTSPRKVQDKRQLVLATGQQRISRDDDWSTQVAHCIILVSMNATLFAESRHDHTHSWSTRAHFTQLHPGPPPLCA